MKLVASEESLEELIINTGTQAMLHMQWRALQQICQDTSEVFITGILLEIFHLQTHTEAKIRFHSELNQDSQFLDNGKLTGVKVITCQLDIIYSKIQLALPDTSSIILSFKITTIS